MKMFSERNIIFHFLDEVNVEKFDGWEFVKQYQQQHQGTKAVDFIVLRPDDECCWLIEATDYRIFANHRTIEKVAKPNALIDEFDRKIRDSLTLINAATVNAPSAQQTFAQAALAKVKKKEQCCIWNLVLKGQIFTQQSNI